MSNELVVGDEIPQSSELIEVHVSELERLFNPIDPSPLPDRDLDSKTEEFIVSSLVDRALSGRQIGALIRESILIGGWVAMWRPLEIFLYDWWPILVERKMFDRLSRMKVGITFKSSADAKR